MTVLAVIILAAWLAWAVAANALTRNPRHEPGAGLTLVAMRTYARLVHNLRIDGFENIPRTPHAGPLVVICNHTAGVDPVLVQAAVPFEIRWMMARDMMPRLLDPLWDFAGVIPVNRGGADTTAARQALRYLQRGSDRIDELSAPAEALGRGGVIGIFPEGGIERPRRTILPFQPGVGLLIHRSQAPVLQVIIDGTPAAATAWGSLTRRSRSRLRFLPIKSYADTGLSATEIAADLRQRLIDATGWRTTDRRTPETQR